MSTWLPLYHWTRARLDLADAKAAKAKGRPFAAAYYLRMAMAERRLAKRAARGA